MTRIRICALRVKRDRVVARVMVDPKHAYLTPDLAQQLVAQRPYLPQHACVNPEGEYFGVVLDHTSIPHALEHIVIDLQTEAFARIEPSRVFTGTTRWTDRKHGIAEVSVSYRDDLTALRAFRDAAALLNGLR